LIILILQIIPSIISILILYIILKEFNVIYSFEELLDILTQDGVWKLIDNKLNDISGSISISWIKHVSSLKKLNLINSIFMIISLVINLFSTLNILYLIFPGIFFIYLVVLKKFSRKEHPGIDTFLNWLVESINSINQEYQRLLHFKYDDLSDYFKQIDKKLSRLKFSIEHLREIKIGEDKKGNLREFVKFLNDHFQKIKYSISKVYQLRGMISTLMSIILKLRETHIDNLTNLQQKERKDYEQELLEIWERKQEKFKILSKHLEKEIEVSLDRFKRKEKEFKENSEEIIRKKKQDFSKTVNKTFKELDSKWNKKISSYEVQLNERFEEFEELNKGLNNKYKKLVSKLTDLSFKNYIKKSLETSGQEFTFENFRFISNIFIKEVLELPKEKVVYAFDNLCSIHNKLIED
jgi:hypothetical protein